MRTNFCKHGLAFIKSKLALIIYSLCAFIGALVLNSCQQEEVFEETVSYNTDIYTLKEYMVERHPPVVRNGFGIDIYHEGNSGCDTIYFSIDLPPYHPNNCSDSGTITYRYYEGNSIAMEYDLLFYNEFAYSQNYAGDYNGTGYPVIFMYTDPDKENSTKAVMVGQGIDCFDAFTADSISAYCNRLTSDAQVCMADFRTYLNTETVQGTITLHEDVSELYSTLTIGNKFRPNIGNAFEMESVSDESQINLQPVFLIQTREGLYAKFMVTRFKGTGSETQKLTIQWQAIEEK